MSLKFFDKAGREVKPGDLIVYGHALGRCAGLQYGLVLKVQEGKDLNNYMSDTKTAKIKVQGVDQDWNQKPKLLRTSVLSFPERILILDKVQVPKEVRDLLNTVKI